MSEAKELVNENIAIAKMVAKEVMAKVGVVSRSGWGHAFPWARVVVNNKGHRVLLSASHPFENWDEVVSEIVKASDYIESVSLNWD